MTTIAGLARAGGVGIETVRFYQRRGLLPTPARPEKSRLGSGVRRYGPEDIRRLRFIRSAQTAGFTLEQIGELLSLDAATDHARAHSLATAQLAVLDARIEELQRARAALHHLAEACAGTDAGLCPIIEAFDTPALEGAL